MEIFSPQNHMSKKASNEILFNMKAVDLALTFPKSPRTWISHIWLTRYGPIIFQKCLKSKWHNFHMECPIWVIFLWANPISHVISCCIIKIHQKYSWQKVKFQVDSFEFLVWTCDFEKYLDFSHKTNSNTLQMANVTCSNCYFTVALNIWKGHFWTFTKNAIMLIKPILVIVINKVD